MSAAASVDLAPLRRRLRAPISDGLLRQALTHRSYAYEHGGLDTNERLEFLGDSVLGVVVTDALYRRHPTVSEGHLAKLRSAVVNMRALADVGRRLELGRFLLLGRGEENTGGRDKGSIVADAVEAVIGAIYLELGLAVAAEVIHDLFDPVIASAEELGAGLDWKTSLQELVAAADLGSPEYVVDESGPDHAKRFTASARIAGADYGLGEGRSKKEAEQAAASNAWRRLRAERGEA